MITRVAKNPDRLLGLVDRVLNGMIITKTVIESATPTRTASNASVLAHTQLSDEFSGSDFSCLSFSINEQSIILCHFCVLVLSLVLIFLSQNPTRRVCQRYHF